MKNSAKEISKLFKTIGSAPRIQIMLAIGTGEACVCHLETMLGLRQAYISQHLMALRQAKVLTSRREGRFIYYRLRNTGLLGLLENAAELSGSRIPLFPNPVDCPCPACSPSNELIPIETI